MSKSIWDHIGRGFASVARGFAKAAVWASGHPEVLRAIGGVAASAGVPPGLVKAVNDGAAIATAVNQGRR